MECVSDTLLGQVKTLLLATDGSHFSEGAVQEAFFFSQTCLAKLIVLSVVPTRSESVRAAHFALRKGREALAPYFDHLRAMAQESSTDLEIVVIGSSRPEQAVVEQARLRNADLILMGRHGRAGRLARLVGRTTTGVVAQGFPRVLVVPREATLTGPHVLVGVNESPNGREALSAAIGLSRQSKTFQKMTIMSVLRREDRREEIEELVRSFCAQAWAEGQIATCEPLVVVGDTAQSIVEAARERQADMIIVGGHGRAGLTKFLLGHTTGHIIGQAHCPVLVATAQEDNNDPRPDTAADPLS